jgi:hypothetical protein
MDGGRVLYAGLRLLDRQLVDRAGRLSVKVDDLELERDEATGHLYVTAVLTGPGALVRRMGATRLGAWLERVNGVVFPSERDNPARIPFGLVSDIGDHVTLAAEREELATYSTERWVRDHVIGPIPGSGHDAPE